LLSGKTTVAEIMVTTPNQHLRIESSDNAIEKVEVYDVLGTNFVER